jgi:hypothetical protein
MICKGEFTRETASGGVQRRVALKIHRKVQRRHGLTYHAPR